MRHHLYLSVKLYFVCLLSGIVLLLLFSSPLSVLAATPANKSVHPSVTLNIPQGPLGVTLTVKGSNFHPGAASITYADGSNRPGTFVAPSDMSVLVQENGTFVSTNVVLPSAGGIGTWRIVITDSAGTVATAPYKVLAYGNMQHANVPTLQCSSTNAKIGDLIAFTGTNWLPQGTSVQVQVVTDTATIPLLVAPVKSDKDGTITGAFHIPTTLNPAQTIANLSAVDTSGAMRVQVQINLPGLSPTPTVLPTPSPVVKAEPSSTSHGSTTISFEKLGQALFQLNSSALVIIALIVGGTLGLAGMMLILFQLPWRKRFYSQATVPYHRQKLTRGKR